jgi:hypothetical protein
MNIALLPYIMKPDVSIPVPLEEFANPTREDEAPVAGM